MVQTNATVRFFARRGNLMGQTAEESFKLFSKKFFLILEASN